MIRRSTRKAKKNKIKNKDQLQNIEKGDVHVPIPWLALFGVDYFLTTFAA